MDRCDDPALAHVGSLGWAWTRRQMWPGGWEAPPLSGVLTHLGVCIWPRRRVSWERGSGAHNHPRVPSTEGVLPLVHPRYQPTFYRGRTEAQKGRGQGPPAQGCVWWGRVSCVTAPGRCLQGWKTQSLRAGEGRCELEN